MRWRSGTARQLLRFERMLRRHSNTVLGLSVAVFVAAVIGVQLGESAIGAIHPAYFQGEPLPPRAVDGRERPPIQPAYYQAYDWEQGAAARAIACGDNCGPPTPYDAYAYAEVPPVRVTRVTWNDEPPPPAEPDPWAPGQVSDEPRAAVTRFADYPIEAKPEPAEDEELPPAERYDDE